MLRLSGWVFELEISVWICTKLPSFKTSACVDLPSVWEFMIADLCWPGNPTLKLEP